MATPKQPDASPFAGTREEWLNAAVPRLNDLIAETGLKPAKKVLVSAGWPRKDRGGKVIGQCYNSVSSKGVNHIFISPTLAKELDVLHVLLHELIHAADDCQSKHTGAFARAARSVGLEGKMTATVPGKDLRATLRTIIADLGKYPHVRLNPAMVEHKPQTTRMLKCECKVKGCGYTVRTTQKWLDVAVPKCPIAKHGVMEVEVK